jgi:Kdo2-lipid IVA lauroyltransferase/acyltransferase
MGWLVYVASPTYARRVRENLQLSGVGRHGAEVQSLRRQVVAETGKGAMELASLWFAPDAAIRRWAHCETWPW